VSCVFEDLDESRLDKNIISGAQQIKNYFK
jgi:hypothetical protein